MTTSLLISIVLPTYNGSAHLQDAINSCLAQSYQHLELIIVNDGSSDPQVQEILNRQTDPRILIKILEHNVGLPAALNEGFCEAHGDLLTWTSDDNLYRPKALEIMARRIALGDADFVYAQAASIDENGHESGQLAVLPPDQLIFDNCIGPCFLFTRQVREQTGFYDPAHRLVEDYDYWLRVNKRFRMLRIDDDLYLYRFHSKGLTSTEGHDRILAAREKVRRAHFSSAQLHAAGGLRAYARRDYPVARRLLAKAILSAPLRRELYKPLMIAMLPDSLLKIMLKINNWI